ncbi:MAG: ABC transporter permease [Bacteroidales bacterium]|nr:ABC transporter permease [Bacteroidales bacterium]
MKFEYYIAKRLIKHQGKNFSGPIIRIAQVSIMLSFALMLLSVSVLQGFKKEIKNKITGFSSHIQITQYTNSNPEDNSSYISLSADEKHRLKQIKGVRTLVPVIHKGGVLMFSGDFQAVVCKGIDSSYDKTFFEQNITEGRFPELQKESKQEILVSKTVKDKLKLKTGGKIKVYFYVNNSYRAKNFYISGIYDTGLGEYDETFLLCDAKVLKDIFSVDDGLCSYYEVGLTDFSLMEEAAEKIYYAVDRDKTVVTAKDLEPNLFSWLGLLDSNVVMIMIIMMLVCVVTLSSVVLIMIFEKKALIGILKSFGADNAVIIKIFLCRIAYVLICGMLCGNILAITSELIQKKFHLISLDQESYYINTAPVDINPVHILLINVGMVAVCLLCLLLPAASINKMSPVKNIRFE